MVELGIIGAKNSGKTTVIESLVSFLTGEGLRIATIKHTSHSHRFDTPGKDSYRHRQAGARLTVTVSDEEVAVFARPDSLDVREVQHLVGSHIDLWLIEGDRYAERPKVLVTRLVEEFSGALPENIVATIGPERFGEVPVHFETTDYRGLGSFVSQTIVGVKTEIRQ